MKSTQALPVARVVIEPEHGWNAINFKELWEYRELILQLAWRDISVRYKQTFLGASWAILQPFMTMVVFSIIFGRLAQMPSDGVPYPIFTYTALLPWQLFAGALGASSNSLVSNTAMITKVYFPRIIIPLAPLMTGLIDFALAFLVLLAMMVFYGVPITWTVLTLPLFLLLALTSALAVGIWLAALNVKYRDVRYAVPFLTQFWMFLTPIAYSGSLIPEEWRFVYSLNPMTGVVEGFRWAMLGNNGMGLEILWVSVPIILLLLVSGLYYFKRVESTFADVI
jgi:lipopolysaccharide transport system permease protein